MVLGLVGPTGENWKFWHRQPLIKPQPVHSYAILIIQELSLLAASKPVGVRTMHSKPLWLMDICRQFEIWSFACTLRVNWRVHFLPLMFCSPCHRLKKYTSVIHLFWGFFHFVYSIKWAYFHFINIMCWALFFPTWMCDDLCNWYFEMKLTRLSQNQMLFKRKKCLLWLNPNMLSCSSIFGVL